MRPSSGYRASAITDRLTVHHPVSTSTDECRFLHRPVCSGPQLAIVSTSGIARFDNDRISCSSPSRWHTVGGIAREAQTGRTTVNAHRGVAVGAKTARTHQVAHRRRSPGAAATFKSRRRGGLAPPTPDEPAHAGRWAKSRSNGMGTLEKCRQARDIGGYRRPSRRIDRRRRWRTCRVARLQRAAMLPPAPELVDQDRPPTALALGNGKMSPAVKADEQPHARRNAEDWDWPAHRHG